MNAAVLRIGDIADGRIHIREKNRRVLVFGHVYINGIQQFIGVIGKNGGIAGDAAVGPGGKRSPVPGIADVNKRFYLWG